MYGGCEKVQDWSRDLASNESGVLPSERVNVGETESHGMRVKESEREGLYLCGFQSAGAS